MGDLFKALTGGLWRFVYAWMIPTAIMLMLFWFLVMPAGTTTAVTDVSPNDLILLAFVILGAAIVLALNATPLYRLLEGYIGPSSIKEKWKLAQVGKWKKLVVELNELDKPEEKLQRSLVRESLKLYPEDESDFLPTALGNAISRLEGYGWKRYRLDHNLFWYELRSLAPDNVRKEVEDAESVVDFFTAFAYLSALFSVSALGITVVQQDVVALVAAIVAALLAPFFYNRAVKSTLAWQLAVQALVNVGRQKLAEAFGLVLPQSLQEERRMWRALSAFVLHGDREDKWGPTLERDKFATGKYGDVLSEYRLSNEQADASTDRSDVPQAVGVLQAGRHRPQRKGNV